MFVAQRIRTAVQIFAIMANAPQLVAVKELFVTQFIKIVQLATLALHGATLVIAIEALNVQMVTSLRKDTTRRFASIIKRTKQRIARLQVITQQSSMPQIGRTTGPRCVSNLCRFWIRNSNFKQTYYVSAKLKCLPLKNLSNNAAKIVQSKCQLVNNCSPQILITSDTVSPLSFYFFYFIGRHLFVHWSNSVTNLMQIFCVCRKHGRTGQDISNWWDAEAWTTVCNIGRPSGRL